MAWAPSAQAAGDVQVTVTDGNVVITGDGRDNNILIIGVGRVVGRAGTTVNGERLFDAEGVTNDIDIEMRGGDDFVRVEVTPGLNLAIPGDLQIHMGKQDDMIEFLGVTVAGETRIDTGDGNDIVFIDGVFSPSEEFIRSDFAGKFTAETGDDEDLVEINHAIFRGEVEVAVGSGIDGVCSHASEYQSLDQTSFDGGEPDGFPGDGFFELTVELAGVVINFEEFPDDCSFLGGRDF
ncbi:MAG TPA: hypothetical protein VFE34_20300 [Dongiaceae bacterium]|jgi:hypothetical protein|nr:hypothetical protein [Dongiaceae bacterium]